MKERNRPHLDRRLFLILATLLGTGAIFSLAEEREVLPVEGGCQATLYKTNFDLPTIMGITIPNLHGDSNIYIDTEEQWIINHELGHAEQVCEEGALMFIINYFQDMQKYEIDAQQRGGLVGQ